MTFGDRAGGMVSCVSSLCVVFCICQIIRKRTNVCRCLPTMCKTWYANELCKTYSNYTEQMEHSPGVRFSVFCRYSRNEKLPICNVARLLWDIFILHCIVKLWVTRYSLLRKRLTGPDVQNSVFRCKPT